MGTPLVEPDTGSAGHSIVTFVARGGDEVGGIRLDTNLDALLVADEYVSPEALGQMMQLDGSDVWYRSFRLRNEVRAPYRFVSPGNRGHYLLATNRHMRDVLRARGYVLRYEEFNGVHSELSWQDGLAEGLVHLLARDIP